MSPSDASSSTQNAPGPKGSWNRAVSVLKAVIQVVRFLWYNNQLEPTLSILDETDSGLDIDALRIVADGVNKLNSDENALILITHYQRLLDHIKPNFVHVLSNGKIIKSGGKELAHELEAQGYDWLTTEN